MAHHPELRLGQGLTPDFDVALSFAGEDRKYVEKVALELRSIGIRVFYDKHETVTLWGKDLYTYLQQVYSERARYTVIFVSRAYKDKLWANHERTSAQARAFRERQEYILPARFDDTQLPGLLETTGYVELKGYTPKALAVLIRDKLGARPHYLPENPDRLMPMLRARTPRAMMNARRAAGSMFNSFSLMTPREREIVAAILVHGCSHDLPDNVHISIDLLQRVVAGTRDEIVAVLARVDCLNFTSRLVKLKPRDDARLGETEQILLSFYAQVKGTRRSYGTRVLWHIGRCITSSHCAVCAIAALVRLDLSQLSSKSTSAETHQRSDARPNSR